MTVAKRIIPPRVWDNYSAHFDTVITDEWYKLIFQLSTEFISATHRFFGNEGVDPVLMPVTVGTISSPMGKGSDSIPVQINLFGKKAYLADSMQFQLEYLLRLAKKGVYYIMPTFRGEDPSRRHLNQFFHSEVEIRGGFEDAIALAERYVIALTASISDKFGSRLENFGIGTAHLKKVLELKNGFPRITFKEACNHLGKDAGFFNVLEGGLQTISSKGELEILKKMGGICWLTSQPAAIVPFYQARHNDSQTSCCGDLLCGIGEVLGLGQRHRTYESTLAAIKENEVEPGEYEWYLNLKSRYPLATAGFGMGMERFLLWVLKHDDIRDIPLIQRMKSHYNEP